VKLTDGEQARLYSRGTENIDAYLKYWQGRSYFLRVDKGNIIVARQIYEEVIALDPKWEPPYSFLGWTYWIEVVLGWSNNPEESLKKAFQYAQKAISLNESFSAHGLLSWIYMMTRQYDKALEEGEKSVALGPNSADAHAWYAQVLISAGEPAKGIFLAEKALRMNPFPPGWTYNALAWGYGLIRDYERAIQASEKAISIMPGNIRARLSLIVSYVMSGYEKEARAQAQEVLRIDPSFSLGHLARGLPFKNDSDNERVVDALRKAGLE
jgi:adenylate cyclase